MKVLTYSLCLEQPLLATSLEGDPNSSRSHDYIPGSQMRGLLIRRYREHAQLPGDNLPADPVAQQRFFSGAVRFLHAYPLLANGQRALPMPLSLRRRKGQSSGAAYAALNLADPEGRELLEEAGLLAQFQALGEPFCALAGREGLRSYRPDHTVAIHIQRDRTYGRARRGSGEVFRYDALAAGQWFAGAIVCDDDDDAQELHALLAQEPTAWLGRSRSAQYGRVRIDQVAILDPAWREASGERPTPGAPLTMTLLSDLLLRDALGREIVAPAAETLGKALGLSVAVLTAGSFTATTLVGSYNTTASLPAVQRHALRAGSVITLQPDATLSPDELTARLASVMWSSLGERRAEGYGRVAFNWVTAPQLQVSRASAYRPVAAEPPTPLSATASRMAGLMANRLLARQIDEAIARFVRDQVVEASDVVARMPSSSQIGRVRVLIRRALPTGDVAAVRAGLGAMEQAGKEQFERARIVGQPLDRWLADLLADPGSDSAAPIWRALTLAPGSQPLAGTLLPPDPQLARVTALRLAEAVLAAAARQRRREVTS